MKRMQSGAAHTADDESEDLEIDYSDVEEGEEEPGSGGDFFDGEDLDEVEIESQGGDEEEDAEVGSELEYDSEVEMGEDGEEEQDESEGELLPTTEGTKNKKGDKKKKNQGSTFASYEEFAHLLDDDSDEDKKTKEHFSSNAIGKRTY